jgi:hypothetical protein
MSPRCAGVSPLIGPPVLGRLCAPRTLPVGEPLYPGAVLVPDDGDWLPLGEPPGDDDPLGVCVAGFTVGDGEEVPPQGPPGGQVVVGVGVGVGVGVLVEQSPPLSSPLAVKSSPPDGQLVVGVAVGSGVGDAPSVRDGAGDGDTVGVGVEDGVGVGVGALEGVAPPTVCDGCGVGEAQIGPSTTISNPSRPLPVFTKMLAVSPPAANSLLNTIVTVKGRSPSSISWIFTEPSAAISTTPALVITSSMSSRVQQPEITKWLIS